MPIETIIRSLEQLRQHKPLVVNITNYVVMNNTANALLALGASPIMAHSRQEMAEMMGICGALVINIGTLDSNWIPRMYFAVEQANKYNKPVVLDPVGCGATRLRTDTSREIARLANTLIIRGNASEIIAMAGQNSRSKGVDALDHSDQAIEAAKGLSHEYQCSVVVSGETDHIINRHYHVSLNNGSAMLPLVTGTGCSLSALTGAFAAIGDLDGLSAAAIMSIAGEMAAEKSAGPGSLQVHLLDALYHIDEAEIRQRIHLGTHPL